MAPHEQNEKPVDKDRGAKTWIIRIVSLIIALTIFFFLFVYPHTRFKNELDKKKYGSQAIEQVPRVAANDSFGCFADLSL
jgi:hypothetical protein